MGSPDVCSDYVKIMEIQEIIDAKSAELEENMNTWLEISETN